MPNFLYRVKNEAGKVIQGEAKAPNVEDLKLQLKEKGYVPLDISEKKSTVDLNNIQLFSAGVGIKELAMFCRQFSIVLEAGVPIAVALDVLRNQTSNPTLKAALNDIFEQMQKGVPLSSALRQHKNIFPNLFINLVMAGEVSGQLESIFKRLAETYENEYRLNSKIKGALSYPAFVVIVAIAVIMVLMVKVVPSFVKILGNFKVELPIFTKILISISAFFQNTWIILILGAVSLFFAVRAFMKTESGRETVHSMILKIPLIGDVIVKTITARFTRTLSVLLGSGVLLIQSLEVVQKITGNAVVEKKLNSVIEEVKKGKGLFSPVLGMKFFPPLIISMIKIGEESGKLDFALAKSADFYDQEVETSLAKLTAMIEPIVMVVMALVVGFIILSILYPMLSIYNTMAN